MTRQDADAETDATPREEVTRLVGPLVDHSNQVTRDLFGLLEGRTADLQDEIDETVASLGVFFNKWIVEIMYILRVRGTLRFNELKDGLQGISGRTLSTRLKELVKRGIVNREVFDEMPVRVEYSLTEKGKDVANLSMPLILYLRADDGAVERDEKG